MKKLLCAMVSLSILFCAPQAMAELTYEEDDARIPDNAAWMKYFVESTGDNTDMTGTIQAMLDNNKFCQLGPGDFYVSGVVIPTNATLRGCGTATRLILSPEVESGYAVKIGTFGCVQDLKIFGSTSQFTPTEVGKRHGIVFEGLADESGTVPYRSTIENVTFANLSGGAITCTNTGLSWASTLHVSDCYMYWCGAGINVAYFSEYHRFTNISVTQCYYGCICNGGNCNFTNCDFSGNIVGLLIDNSHGQSKNNSHGTFDACSFNHADSNNGTAIRILGAENGEVFTGAQIFFGGIEIENSTGIRFIGANIGRQVPIAVKDSNVVIFSDCTMYSADESPVTQSGNTVLEFQHCYVYQGDVFQPLGL